MIQFAISRTNSNMHQCECCDFLKDKGKYRIPKYYPLSDLPTHFAQAQRRCSGSDPGGLRRSDEASDLQALLHLNTLLLGNLSSQITFFSTYSKGIHT